MIAFWLAALALGDNAPIEPLAADDEIELVAENAVAAAGIEMEGERKRRQCPGGTRKRQAQKRRHPALRIARARRSDATPRRDCAQEPGLAQSGFSCIRRAISLTGQVPTLWRSSSVSAEMWPPFRLMIDANSSR